MAILSKLVKFATKAAYNSTKNSIPSTSLCFIEDTKEIMRNGISFGRGSDNSISALGAVSTTTNSSITGAITITLPTDVGYSMISMWIDVYNYATNTSFSVHCGGYTYINNSTWARPFAEVYGNNYKVRFGYNGTNYFIYIGELTTVWSYPLVIVRDILTGFRPGTWTNAISISYTTDSFATLTSINSKVNYDSSNVNSSSVDWTCATLNATKVTSSGNLVLLSLPGCKILLITDNTASSGINLNSNYFYPVTTKTVGLGAYNNRWSDIYGQTLNLSGEATATKFNGNVIGNVSGSAGVLSILDNRGTNDALPNSYSTKSITGFFNNTIPNIPNQTDSWNSGITVNGWVSSDTTHYRAWQLFSSCGTTTNFNNLYFRQSLTNSTWGTLNKIWHSGIFDPDTKAGIDSPTFTGTPLAPTADATTNSTQIATTAFVKTAVANLVNGAPAELDTLKELADYLQDSTVSNGLISQLAGKVSISGDTMTGALTLKNGGALLIGQSVGSVDLNTLLFNTPYGISFYNYRNASTNTPTTPNNAGGVITINSFYDGSTDWNYQIAFNLENLYYRRGTKSWNTIYSSLNANNSSYSWTCADLNASGYLKSTLNGNTITIGSQSFSYCHFYNSADIPFYFNKSILINGSEVYYANNNNIGTGSTNYAAGNHSHTILDLLPKNNTTYGSLAQTNTTQAYSGLYSYLSYQDSNTPNDYMSILGLGSSIGTGAELAIKWQGSIPGAWIRSKKNSGSWSSWVKLFDETNCNTTAYDWTCKSLLTNSTATINGTLTVNSTITATNNITTSANLIANAASITNLITASGFKINGSSSGELLNAIGGKTSSTELNTSEAYLQWGGKNLVASFSPLDAALVPALGANRIAFMQKSNIYCEYSVDNGTTWTELTLTDKLAMNMVSGPNSADIICGNNTSAIANANYKLKVVLTAGSGSNYTYTLLNKLCLLITTNGASGSYVNVRGVTNDNNTVSILSNQSLNGWSGWNIINFGNTGVYFGGTSAKFYAKLVLEFGYTGIQSGITSVNHGLSIYNIFAYGGVGWATPSNLARTGHVYNYNENLDCIFPSAVKGTGIYDTNVRVYSSVNTNIGTGSTNYAAGNHTHTLAALGAAATSHIHSSIVYSTRTTLDNLWELGVLKYTCFGTIDSSLNFANTTAMVLTAGWDNSNAYGSLVAISAYDGDLRTRGKYNGTVGSWNTIYSSLNSNSSSYTWTCSTLTATSAVVGGTNVTTKFTNLDSSISNINTTISNVNSILNQLNGNS